MTQRPAHIVPPAEIDAATADALAADLLALSSDGAVLVDCSEVTFIDSSGIRVLIEASQRHSESGGSVRVTNPSHPVRRLLEVTGLTDLIEGDD